MFKAAILSVLGLVAGMAGNVANAQFFYSPVGSYYSGGYAVRPYYSAPIPVGVSYYAPAPVIVARPVYTPVVVSRPVYVSPVVHSVYSAPISTVSYSTVSTSLEPTPVYTEPTTTYYEPAPTYVAPAPVYVTAAPVVVSRAIYSPAVVHESLRVGPYSSTYRAHGHGWGTGYSVYERSTPYRTVTRVRGW